MSSLRRITKKTRGGIGDGLGIVASGSVCACVGFAVGKDTMAGGDLGDVLGVDRCDEYWDVGGG